MKQNKVIRYLFILSAIGYAHIINGQIQLDLYKCRDMAVKNNKQSSIAGKQLEKAKTDKDIYRANFLPKFSLKGGYLLTNSDNNYSFSFPVMGSEIPLAFDLDMRNTYFGNISFEQPIYMGGRVTAAYKMAGISEDIATLNKVYTRQELIVQSDEAYWQYVKIQELLESALKYRDVIAELLKNVTDAYGSGLKSNNDVLKVQVKLNEAELSVRKAENGKKLAQMNLCHVIGMPLSEMISVTMPDDEHYFPTDNKANVTTRPEYEILSKQIDLKGQEVKLARSEYLPQIGLMASYGYANGIKLNDEKLLNNDSFSAFLSLNIPLFHWGAGRNKIRSARMQQEIIRMQQDDTLEKMELEVAQATHLVDESRLQEQLTHKSLQQADENRRVSKDQYELGLESLVNYLEAEALWQKAWSEWINAKAELRFNETYYLKATGNL